MPTLLARTASACLLLGSLATAQWSDDAAFNLPLGTGAGSQIQPKVVPDGQGGSWVSWFGGAGFDVWIQHLDQDGVELLGAGGMLVADRGFSSTQDYGLAASSTGDALLVFRDDAPGGVQVSAARVTPDGDLPWGPTHVQLTATAAFVAAPVIAATPDGGAFVAWTQDSDTRAQRLDAAGNTVWAGDTILAPPSGSLSVNDAHPSGDGVILSLVRESGGFGSPRHLWAQRLDAAGATTWGPTGVQVFDGGSLQFGNFPDFLPDAAGGAIFAWYDTAGPLQCFVQRVTAAGAEVFPHDGVAVSTDATQLRVSPDIAHDAVSDEVTVAWTELDAIQSQRGVSAQRLDATGQRLWTDTGVVLVPLGGDDVAFVRAAALGGGSLVAWERSPSFGNDVIEGAWLDAGGAVTVPVFDIASTPSGKGRLTDATTDEDVVLVWNDDRAGDDDVYGQNVNPDGSLGSTGPWLVLRDGLAGVAGVPALDGDGTLAGGDPVTFTLAGSVPGGTAFLVTGVSAVSLPFKSGVLVPSPDVVLSFPLDGAGGLLLPAVWPVGFPAGLVLWFQAWIPDAAGPSGFAASNALQGTTP